MSSFPIDQRALLLLQELRNRSEVISGIRDSLFEAQLEFIDDPSKLKAALCTRRAGKSYGAGADMFTECIQNPGCTCLYIATTREQAKRIMFKDVLKVINKRHKLGAKFNHTTLEVSLPSGSMIYLMGLDSSPEEMDKAYGQKFRKVYIDESGTWKQDQRKLIEEVLEPATADYEGTIAMIGMPDISTKTLFYDITTKPENFPEWSVHKWTWNDNPHVKEQIQRLVDRKIRHNPRIAETAPYRRHYLGQWVVDPGAQVYKYLEGRNDAECLPKEHSFNYVVGLDLGFNDDTSFVVSAYSGSIDEMFIVEVIKRPNLDITGVADQLNRLRDVYEPVKWVVDGASKQAVEELRNRRGFPLEAADKLGKSDMIEIMNADFVMSRIKLLPSAGPLKDEYLNLIWDPKSVKREEHPGCANHAADGALYSWRMCFHYLVEKRMDSGAKDPNQEMEEWWERDAALARKGKLQDPLIRDFGKDYGFH